MNIRGSIRIAMSNNDIPSQRRLALMAGVDVKIISRVITGKQDSLSFANIAKICKALDCSVSEFIRLGEDGFSSESNVKREIVILSKQLEIQKKLNLSLIDDNQKLLKRRMYEAC